LNNPHHHHDAETAILPAGHNNLPLLPLPLPRSLYVSIFPFYTTFSNTTPAPTSFCKCTCFGNSTIVALDAPKASSPSRKTCNDCNRSFCLGYSFCKGEKEDNVFTTCFQRDSAKDQAVVYAFIGATVGLLGWAAIRPWVRRVRERRYTAVPGEGR